MLGCVFNRKSDSVDFSDPLERYMKNNHLSDKKEKNKSLEKEKKSIQFNKHNSLPCSNNAEQKNCKSFEPNFSKKENSPTKVSNKPPKYNSINNIPSFEIPKRNKLLKDHNKKEYKSWVFCS